MGCLRAQADVCGVIRGVHWRADPAVARLPEGALPVRYVDGSSTCAVLSWTMAGTQARSTRTGC